LLNNNPEFFLKKETNKEVENVFKDMKPLQRFKEEDNVINNVNLN
jgi:hypothetical protein